MTPHEFHPLANLFPLIEGQEFEDLVADVAANGVRQAVTLYDNQVLDGRNRYRAWLRSGLGEDKITFRTFEGDDPLGFVISMNLRRRHLTESQRAIIAAELPRVGWGNRAKAPAEALTREERAEMLNVSPRSVDRAQDVVTEGTPELVEAVKAGDVAVSAAAQITSLPKEQQAAIMKQLSRDDSGKLTPEARTHIKQLSKEIRAEEQKAKKDRRAAREADLGARIAALPDKRYGVIVADPEWRFEVYSDESGMDRAAENHYPTSPVEVIAGRPVASIAADDCVLFLWATAPMLREALHVMDSWGFTYKSHYIWAKDRAGTGYWNRNKHELLLIGTKGGIPAPAMGTQDESLIEAPVGEHSAKPEVFLDMIERYFPTLPKIELNRRGPARIGWSAWGLEADTTEGDAPNNIAATGTAPAARPDDAEAAPQPVAEQPLVAEPIEDVPLPNTIAYGAATPASFVVVNLAPPDAGDIPAFLRRNAKPVGGK
jgi:N6-adenosine-specific RNA methylase IME4